MDSTRSPVFRRLALFSKRKGDECWPTDPLIGENAIAIGNDNKVLVILDRANLSVVLNDKLGGLGPVRWLGTDDLLLRGETAAGVYDLSQRKVRWRAKTQLSLGGQHWQGKVLTWPSKNEIELREVASGDVSGRIVVPGPECSYSTLCEGLLICTTVSTGDPIRMVRLADGVVAWQSDLLADMRSTHRVDEADSPAICFVPGSLAGQFIATRGKAMFGCSLEDGRILWKADVHVPYYWPLVEAGRIPVLSNNRFVVIDEATGEVRVDRTYPELQPVYHVKRGSIVGDLVVFPSESGHLVAFSLTSGDLIFLEGHKRVAFWGSAVADGRLLISGSDGNLWVYDGLAASDGAAARVH